MGQILSQGPEGSNRLLASKTVRESTCCRSSSVRHFVMVDQGNKYYPDYTYQYITSIFNLPAHHKHKCRFTFQFEEAK